MTDSCSDQVFDSLLQEMLTNQHPPDLTEQIRQRLRVEFGRDVSQLRTLSHSAAEPRCESAHTLSPSSVADWRTPLLAILAMAAGLCIALAAWRLFSLTDSRDANANSIAEQSTFADKNDRRIDASRFNPSGAPEYLADSDRAAADQQTPRMAPSSRAESRAIEAIELEKLPFNIDPSEPTIAVEPVTVAAQPIKAWNEQEIIAWVDARFDELWSKHNVKPDLSLDEAELQSRMARILTGDRLAMASAAPQELTEKLLRSASFAEHWADQIVGYWLRGTPAANKQDKQGAALRAAIAQQLVARKPWNEIVAGLIASSPDKPEAVFLAALAGANNHRLAGRIGSAVLDEALACARCHDASEDGRVISTDQDEYWSLIAILNGLDVQASAATPGRVLVDRQPQLFADGKLPNVFFERPDGRLQAANYRLPEGDSWRTLEEASTPRESLAKWIATTSVSDEAAVNLAWRVVFGRPLVAQHAAMDGVGLNERRQVLSTLAKQFQAHGRDMAALVGWIVSSQPFRTQPLDIDRQTWLLASDEEILRWNVSAVNFATFARGASGQRQLASLDTAIASVIRWSDSNDERRATLAQPAFSARDAKIKNSRPSATKPGDEPTATYLIRSLQPTAAQTELIDRLVASRLTWSQQVEHIAGLIGESGSDARLQRAADGLLKSKNGDRKAALFQLLQCALLYEEAI